MKVVVRYFIALVDILLLKFKQPSSKAFDVITITQTLAPVLLKWLQCLCQFKREVYFDMVLCLAANQTTDVL